MTLPIDSITHKKLILVKQLYNQAVLRTQSPSGIDSRIIGLICFDLSTETLLKVAVSSLDASKNLEETFQSLFRQCESLMSSASLGSIPDEINIRHVHSLRNDAQHKAKYPNESDISDCRTYTKDFLNKLLNKLWGIGLDSISLTDLIKHAEVKKYLFDAEISFGKKEYVESVKLSRTAFDKTIALVEAALVGRQSYIVNEFAVFDGFGNIKPDKEITTAFQRMQTVLLFTSLGINYSDYMLYSEITGATIFSAGGPDNYGMKSQLAPNEADFALSYSIDTIAKIESQVRDLNAPFGKDRFSWF